jgi:hypothetical protein
VELLQGVGVEVCDPLRRNTSTQSVFSTLPKQGLNAMRTGQVNPASFFVCGYEFLRFVKDE